jgi:hypothetical protein
MVLVIVANVVPLGPGVEVVSPSLELETVALGLGVDVPLVALVVILMLGAL